MAIDQKKLAAALDHIEAHAKTVNTGERRSKVCTPYDPAEFSFPAASKPAARRILSVRAQAKRPVAAL